MANHRLKECEYCGKIKKVHAMTKQAGHWVCRKCNIKSTSFKTMLKCESQCRKFKPRGHLTFEEQRVLFKKLIDQCENELEVKRRLANLKKNVNVNHKIFLEALEETKPSFKEEFKLIWQK